MTAPALPEIRQCQDSTNFLFGATAVAGGGIMAGSWGVMHPVNGGHWSTDADVANWTVVQPPAAKGKASK